MAAIIRAGMPSFDHALLGTIHREIDSSFGEEDRRSGKTPRNKHFLMTRASFLQQSNESPRRLEYPLQHHFTKMLVIAMHRTGTAHASASAVQAPNPGFQHVGEMQALRRRLILHKRLTRHLWALLAQLLEQLREGPQRVH